MKSIRKRSPLSIGAGAAVLSLVAFVSYAVASGATLTDPSTYTAAVFGSFNGNPLVTISKSRSAVPVITGQVAARFNVSSKRTTHGAYVSALPVDIVVKGVARGEFNVGDVVALYDYCMKSGTYGYGYQGGSCGQVELKFNAYNRAAANKNFVVSGYLYPNKPLVVYPQQSRGELTIYVNGNYPYVGTSVASVRLDVGAWAQADQCTRTGGCTSPYVEVIRGISNTLKFPR